MTFFDAYNVYLWQGFMTLSTKLDLTSLVTNLSFMQPKIRKSLFQGTHTKKWIWNTEFSLQCNKKEDTVCFDTFYWEHDTEMEQRSILKQTFYYIPVKVAAVYFGFSIQDVMDIFAIFLWNAVCQIYILSYHIASWIMNSKSMVVNFTGM